MHIHSLTRGGGALSAGKQELRPLVGQWSASLSKRVAANTALLESGTVPTGHGALLTVIDVLSAPDMRVIGTEDALTPVACMRAMILVINVRFCHAHHARPISSACSTYIASPRAPQLPDADTGVYEEKEKFWSSTYLKSNVGRLKKLAARTAARLLSRFHDAFVRTDLQAIASQGMALVVRLPPLLPELTRILGRLLLFSSTLPPPPCCLV
jgi:hypothetical protein